MDDSGKKINLICKFKENGRNREYGAYQVVIAGRTPPHFDQALACQ